MVARLITSIVTDHPELVLTLIPEPSTLILSTLALLTLLYWRRKGR